MLSPLSDLHTRGMSCLQTSVWSPRSCPRESAAKVIQTAIGKQKATASLNIHEKHFEIT